MGTCLLKHFQKQNCLHIYIYTAYIYVITDDTGMEHDLQRRAVY